MGARLFFEEAEDGIFRPVHCYYRVTKFVSCPTQVGESIGTKQMEKEPTRREQKRESARKARERAIYTQKTVRIKEARLEKQKANGAH